MSYKVIAAINDLHWPFADKKAWAVTQLFLRDIKPDKIIMLGDMLDEPQLSKFDKDPSRKDTVQRDADGLKVQLNIIRENHVDAELVYMFGNHDERLRKYIWRAAPGLDSIKFIKLEKILGLEKMNYKFYTRANELHREGNLLFTHGTMVSQDSGMTARRMVKKYGMSIMHGHTHRGGSHYDTKVNKTLGGWENFCLCDLGLAKIWGTGHPNWQQGLSLIYMKPPKRFIVNQILIYKGSLMFGGQEWKV